MSWNPEGRYTAACSHALPRPRTTPFDNSAGHDYGRATPVSNIREGQMDSTAVAICKTVVALNTPKAISQGGGHLWASEDDPASTAKARTEHRTLGFPGRPEAW